MEVDVDLICCGDKEGTSGDREEQQQRPPDKKRKLEHHAVEHHHICTRVNDDGNVCGKRSTGPTDLRRHIKAIHDKLKDVKCDRLLDDKTPCGFTCSHKHHMKRHIKAVHDKLKDIQCDRRLQDGKPCSFICSLKGNLKHHIKAVHEKLKDVKCDQLLEDGKTICPYACSHKSHMKRHIQAIHSLEGQQKKKKCETLIYNLFVACGVTPLTRELRVDFSCFLTSGKYARIDYVKDNLTSHIIFIENDEYQHKLSNYTTSCELRRIADVVTGIRCTGEQRPILWVRFNPHEYEVGFLKRKGLSKKKRVEVVSDWLNAYIPTRPLELVYCFYDVCADGSNPMVTYSPDYSAEMKKLITKVFF
jgi:hypothetical protein